MNPAGTSSRRNRLLTILLADHPDFPGVPLPRKASLRRLFPSRCVVLYRQAARVLGLFLRLPGWEVEASLVFSLSWWRHGMGCWTHDVVSGRHYLRLGSLHLTWRRMP
jgi:hypothetical protein